MNTMEVLTLVLVVFAALTYIDTRNNREKHALRVSQIRGQRQIEMRAFLLGLCLPRK